MNFNRLITVGIMTLALLGNSVAQEIPMHIYPGPGGTSAGMSQILAEGLNKRGYKIDFRALNNCSLSKSTWDTSTGPVIMYRDTMINTNIQPDCDVQTTKDNFVLYANSNPIYFCNSKANGKTWEDFIKPGSTHIIGGTNNMPENSLVESFNKEFGIKAKLLQFRVTSELAASAKAGELDFIISNGPWVELQLGAKCFWITGHIQVPGYALGKDIMPKNPLMLITTGNWFIAKGFNPDQMSKLRKDAADIWREDAWVELRKRRAWNDSTVLIPDDKIQEVLETDRNLWNTYKR